MYVHMASNYSDSQKFWFFRHLSFTDSEKKRKKKKKKEKKKKHKKEKHKSSESEDEWVEAEKPKAIETPAATAPIRVRESWMDFGTMAEESSNRRLGN